MSYLPILNEGKSKLYLPRNSSIGGIIALLVLIGALVLAALYPVMKNSEANALLDTINGVTNRYLDNANQVIKSVAASAAALPEEKADLKTLIDRELAKYQAAINEVKPLTRQEILDVANQQLADYNAAQKLIAESPFKDIDHRYVPATEEGNEYLKALKATAPPRFEYVQVHHAIVHASDVMRSASQKLILLANYQKQVHATLYPEKAREELQAEVAALKEAEANKKATRFQFEATEEPAQQQRTSGATQRPAPSENIDDGYTPSFFGRQVEAAPTVSAAEKLLAEMEVKEAIQQAEAQSEAQQAIRAAEMEVQKAEREAQQKQRNAERAAQQAAQQKQRAAQQAEQQKQREAQQAQQAEERKQREAQQAQQRAEQQAKAKAKECQSGIAAGLKCTAQGYNPLTGYKR